jgi:transcriptional regulator with XRE-family HTH domain
MIQLKKTFDPTEIGSRIRNIRKKKEIGIIELAKAVGFSSGKMSNIENGKLDKVNEEDLDKICLALNISTVDFLKSSDNEHEEKNPSINFSLASHYIGMGLYSEATEILFGTRLLYHLEQNPKHLAQCNFLMGELMYSSEDTSKAIYYFKAVIENGSNREQVIRSFNGLSCIFFERGDVTSAIQFSLDALSFAQRVRSNDLRSDLINTHFNLALIYCQLGLTNQSTHHISAIEGINKNNDRIMALSHHLKAVLLMQKGDHLKARDLLFEVIPRYVSANTIEYFNTIGSLYVLSYYNHAAHDIKNFVELGMDEFLEGNHSNKAIMNQLLVIMHTIIENAIFQGEYSKAFCFLEKCNSLSEKMPELSENYRTFYFNATYLQHTEKNPHTEAEYLKKSLSCNNNDILTRALIHHRLGELAEQGKDRSHFYYASSLFHEHMLMNGKMEISITKFLPQLIF